MDYFDRSDHYETIKEIDPVGRTHRYLARERTLGTPVVTHRVDIEGLNAKVDGILADLSQEAQVRDVHIPPIFDAWVSGTDLWYVRREFDGVPLVSADARSRLTLWGRDYLDELAYQTLAALGALHDFIVAHKRLAADSFVVTDNGMVIMRNTGVWRRVNERAESGGMSRVALVSNLERTDVAAWAAMVVAIASNTDFNLQEDDEGVLMVAREDVPMMEAAVDAAIMNEAFAEMLKKALQGFLNQEGGGFENAGEALQNYPRMAMA